jgi:hypothetical protein
MLSAIPMLNNNNNKVAMAQGYDNYYGDNSYSQYPTDDKKYECRTGPFQGFFVSSVEFCKNVKFDDKKRDGKQGLKVHQVHKVLQEQQEQQVYEVYKVKEENQEHQVLTKY